MAIPVKRVAVIGAGPAGAIAVDALVQEKAFDLIRGFERREGPGGCWIGDTTPPPPLTNLTALANRTADPPLPIPDHLPAATAKSSQPRFTESSVYPYLETNVDYEAMQYTGADEGIPEVRSDWSVTVHGKDTPFRHWTVLRDYVAGLVQRHEDVFVYDTTVERAEKVGAEWKLTLRHSGKKSDYWWTETFDAFVVASGHYAVPYVPVVDGLDALEKRRPGSVLHSKQYRGRDAFEDKTVVVVGASVSAADIAVDLTGTAKAVHAVVVGHKANLYFGGSAFDHPAIRQQTTLERVDPTTRTAYFADGSHVDNVDHFIFGTGYSWTLPFLPQVPVRNNRVPDLYLHVVWRHDPSLLFVGAVNAGLTFKIFEWQAVLAARLLAHHNAQPLPPSDEMRRWEDDRIRERGDSPAFALVYPDFEDYFGELRRIAGETGPNGVGRRLPPFDRSWFRAFMDGHERRKRMWKRNNAKALAGEPIEKPHL